MELTQLNQEQAELRQHSRPAISTALGGTAALGAIVFTIGWYYTKVYHEAFGISLTSFDWGIDRFIAQGVIPAVSNGWLLFLNIALIFSVDWYLRSRSKTPDWNMLKIRLSGSALIASPFLILIAASVPHGFPPPLQTLYSGFWFWFGSIVVVLCIYRSLLKAELGILIVIPLVFFAAWQTTEATAMYNFIRDQSTSSTLPAVVLFTTDNLEIPGCVSCEGQEISCGGVSGQPCKYVGLRLLIFSGDIYYFVCPSSPECPLLPDASGPTIYALDRQRVWHIDYIGRLQVDRRKWGL